MAYVVNSKVWTKSYMLEVVNSFGMTKDVFTFSVPPQSEDYTIPLRLTETKTLAGAEFDNYGVDTKKISLSGSTINQQKKYIHRGLAGAPRYLTGEEEITAIKNFIEKWNTVKEVKTGRKLFLYDLSKMSVIEASTGIATKNFWQVEIINFKQKRAKNRPLAYDYTIEFSVVEANPGRVPFFKNFGKWINEFEDKLESAKQWIDLTTGAIDVTTTIAVDFANAIKELSAAETLPEAVQIAWGNVSNKRIVKRSLSGSVYNIFKTVYDDVLLLADISGKNNGENSKSTEFETYTITFDTGIGSHVDTQTIKGGEMVVKPSDPAMENYAFAGWYTDKECTIPYNFDNLVTSSFTIYAKWDKSRFLVRFYPNNGKPISNVYVNKNETVQPIPNPDYYGYGFDTWHLSSTTGDIFDFDTPITEDTYLYASYLPATMVIFQNVDGSEIYGYQALTGPEKKATFLDVDKEGFSFYAWYTDTALKNEFDFASLIEADTELRLYAKWLCNFEVNFESNRGSPVASQTVVEGDYVARPIDPKKNAYSFVAWYRDSLLRDEFDFETPITGNIKLYAKWRANDNTVSFDTFITSNPQSQGVASDTLADYPITPTVKGYSFRYWFADFNNSKQPESEPKEFDWNTPIRQSMTLYAMWDKVRVLFDSQGGTAISYRVAVVGGCIEAPPIPSKTGFTFAGWYTNPECSGDEFDFSTKLYHCQKLYAKWMKTEE